MTSHAVLFDRPSAEFDRPSAESVGAIREMIYGATFVNVSDEQMQTLWQVPPWKLELPAVHVSQYFGLCRFQ
jgi:hypothetical protein